MARGQFCPGSNLRVSVQGLKSGLLQAPRETLGRGPVFRHVRDEHLRQRPRLEAEPARRVRVKNPQALDLHHLPGSQAAHHNLRQLLGG